MSNSYPEPPWTLRGRAVAFPLLLRRARVATPPPLSPLAIGGRVPGLAIVAWYGPGSSLEYHELAVLAAVRCGARPGAFVLGLRVDDPASQAGGREIWALDKQMAAFAWTSAGRSETIEVRDGATMLFRARYRALVRPSVPSPTVPLRTFVVRNGRTYAFTVRVAAHVRPVRLEARIVAAVHPPRAADAGHGPRDEPAAGASAAGRSDEVRPGPRPDAPRPFDLGFGLAFERLRARVCAPLPI